MNCRALATKWPPPRSPRTSRSALQDGMPVLFVPGMQSPPFAASSLRSCRRTFNCHRHWGFLCHSGFTCFGASPQPKHVAGAANGTSEFEPSRNWQENTLFLHVLDEHLAIAQRQQELGVPTESEVPAKTRSRTGRSDQLTPSTGNFSELECERRVDSETEDNRTGETFSGSLRMMESTCNSAFQNPSDLSRQPAGSFHAAAPATGCTRIEARPIDGTEEREADISARSGRVETSVDEFEFSRVFNVDTAVDHFGEDQMSCSESTRADFGVDHGLDSPCTSGSSVFQNSGDKWDLSTGMVKDGNVEMGGIRNGDSSGLGNDLGNLLTVRKRLRTGRQVFLTGDRKYSQWRPRNEELLGEACLPDDVHFSADSVKVAVDGNEDTVGRSEIEEVEKPDETAGQTLSGTDKQDDLFVEFLKKRRQLWGDKLYVGMKGKQRRDGLEEGLANSTTELTTKSIDWDWKSAGVQSYGSGTESLSESEKQQAVKAATEKLSKTLGSEWTDETHKREAVAQSVVEIASVLPLNASLETYLTPFAGKISTGDGNLALKLLGETFSPWAMLSFFQWMRVHRPCLLDSRSLCAIFFQLGSSGMGEHAFLQYQNMPDNPRFHCVQVYNSLIGALAKSGRHAKIPLVLKQMKKRRIERDHFTYCILLAATKGHGDGRADEVWSMFDEMRQAGLKPSVPVYGALVKAFCDEGRLKEALLVLVSMEKSGLSPNVIVYNMLIDAHGKARLLEEAEGLLVEMKRRGLSPTASTYNSLINAYGKANQLDAAEELAGEMQSEGIEPSVVTYTALIGAYGKQKMSEKAAAVFLKMRKKGILPTTHSYTALINAYAEAGWHDKAQKAFDDMKVVGLRPTVETYTALLDAYRRAGHLDMVRHLWSEIKEDGCELTHITYRTLVDAFGKHGYYVEARDVVDEFRKYGIHPDTMIFNILLNAYARGGVHTKLPKVYKEMQEAGCEPDSYTYCTLIYAYIRIRDFTRAFEYESEMVEKGLMPPGKVYRKLKFILDGKHALKLENDTKAKAGQEPKYGEKKSKSRNPQRSKQRKFKQFLVRGPLRGSERAKALWKDKEKG